MADAGNFPTDQSDNRRDRSTIEFPYLDLDDALDIAKGVHSIGGTSCQKEQLAAHLNQAASGGGFSLRLGTAKMYGLIRYERGTINLTELGVRACDTQQEKSARVEAFLSIPLYKALYEKFKGTALPPSAGLEAEIVTLGVAPKQKDRARQVFQRSAKEAGFFEFGNDRLVLPATGKRVQAIDSNVPKQTHREDTKRDNRGAEHDFSPFIQGLLQKLPPEGHEWTIEERKRWLQLAALAFDMMYEDAGKGGTIVVEVKGDLKNGN